MDDEMRTGHPRTLADHEDMRLRSVQRAQGENTAVVASQQGVRVGVVSNIDPQGAIQIWELSDEQGEGPWFKNLNFTQPFPGESVFYTYANGAPVVLGPLADDNRPWRVPITNMPDTFFFDEFDIGTSASGSIGLARYASGQSGGSVSLDAGTDKHPGQVSIIAGTTIGNYAGITGGFFPPNSIDEIEYMVSLGGFGNSIAGQQAYIGLGSTLTSTQNAVLARYVGNDAGANAGWSLAMINGGTITSFGYTDPIIPIVGGNWYKLRFLRLEAGVWMLTVTDMTVVPQSEGLVMGSGFPSASMSSYIRTLSNTAAQNRILVDYVWWTRKRLARI